MALIPAIEEISKGIKVVSLSRRFLRSASIALLVGRGSFEDPVDGCACLTSRMRLRLTQQLNPIQLQVALDRLGATVEASTERDLMLLRVQVPFKRVADCMQFLAELFTSPSFQGSEVEKEKTAQKLEYEKIRQDPTLASIADAWEATFPKNPLGHPVTGYPNTIEKLTPEILEKFDADTRKGAQLVIGVVGPQPESELIRCADLAFEKVRITPHVETHKAEPSRGYNVLRRPLKVKQTTFSVGIVTCGVSSPDYPTFLLIEDYLGSERHYAGVLFNELREKRGLTYFASARLTALRDLGLLTAFAGVEHRKVTEAISLMLETITKLRNKPISEKELEQLKTFHRQAVETRLEVPYQTAMWLATNAFRGGKLDFESYVSDIQAVSTENIKDIAEELFVPSHVALSVAGSPPDDKTLKKIMKEEIE